MISKLEFDSALDTFVSYRDGLTNALDDRVA